MSQTEKSKVKVGFQEVQVAVDECLIRAERHYRTSFSYASISLNLRGKAAGQVRYDRGYRRRSRPELRFNAYLLERYKERFLEEVVPHEVAHLVAYSLHGFRIRPHGPEWKGVMREVFGLEPRVTHEFEIETRPRKTFPYLCACPERVHQLSTIRHNRVRRAHARYICKSCKQELAAEV